MATVCHVCPELGHLGAHRNGVPNKETNNETFQDRNYLPI